MATAAQIERERKRARKVLERDFKRKGKLHLRELRERIKHAKRWRSKRRGAVRKLCRRGLRLARAQAKILRAEHRARARTAADRDVQALRDQARQQCEARLAQADAQAANAVARAMRRFDAEHQYQETVKRYEKKPTAKGAAQRTRREKLRQSDDEVRANIPAELAPVWDELKRKFKDEERRTRTEAFMEWAAEHPADVQRIMDAKIEESIAALIAEEAKQRRELEGLTPRRMRRRSDEDLSTTLRRYESYQGAPEVPF